MYKEKLATLTTICNVEIGRHISLISISFSSFRRKPSPWQLKTVRIFVCVGLILSTYRVLKHCLKSCHCCGFGHFNIYIANISLGENRKIFHEQECEKTLITLLASEVRWWFLCTNSSSYWHAAENSEMIQVYSTNCFIDSMTHLK